MAQVLAQQKFTANQIEVGEEILDAEYCKRVFTLSHSIGYRLSNVVPSCPSHLQEQSQKVDARLELALLAFFRVFRDTSALARRLR